jgi:hypothetical protein
LSRPAATTACTRIDRSETLEATETMEDFLAWSSRLEAPAEGGRRFGEEEVRWRRRQRVAGGYWASVVIV